MSFTVEVKEELSLIEPVCSHCQRALLAAIIRIEGSVYLLGKGSMRLEVVTESFVAARIAYTLLGELYRLRPETVVRRNVLHKTPNVLVRVPMQPGLPEALRELGVIGDGGFIRGVDPQIVRKHCCQEAYLRGIFLGCGFISNLKGDFHFELTVETEELACDLVDLLQSRGVHARFTTRRNNYIIYMKSGSDICDFLALVGAHKCALELEQEILLRSVRNDVNRQMNAEVANTMKAWDASASQRSAIDKVVGWYGIGGLPPALQEYVLLRKANPESTLRELGELADPPLSKSAIAHRARRIEQMAEQIDLKSEN